MLRTVAGLIVALFAVGAAHAQALEGRLKKIAETKTINIGVRADAMPFSFMMAGGSPEGFMIDLCQRVVRSIASQLKVSEVKVSWVLVTVQSRFDVVAKGNADMECGASTITLSRMKQVDFSNVTFVESTALMVRAAAGMRSISDLAGRKIAVIRGTSNERAVAAQVKRRQLNTTLVPVASGEEALAALEAGKVDAFASDRLLLVGAVAKAKDARALALLPDQLSIEPYGIVLPRGDSSLRLAVNTALAQVYSSGEIDEIVRRWFGQFGPTPAIIEAAYLLGSIPE
jgi:glutamate/aspartate transport system substrate-binding protein